MNESELKRVIISFIPIYQNIYHIYPRKCEIITDKGFVNKDNGSMNETHWNCFL